MWPEGRKEKYQCYPFPRMTRILYGDVPGNANLKNTCQRFSLLPVRSSYIVPAHVYQEYPEIFVSSHIFACFIMGILEKIAEIESEVCILCFIYKSSLNWVLDARRMILSLTADGANTEEQGNSPPSWIVKSTTGQVTKGTDHTKRRRGCNRRGLVLWEIVYGKYKVELPVSSQYFERRWSWPYLWTKCYT